jgi:2-polyprenyl-3-methyl-5-hydroxy-6-metoxy-1,4-benzoquinol methylase
MEDKIKEESLSFDKQIIERVEHGHVPDLRNGKRNEWFYNNVWRDPFFADMFFGEIVRKIDSAIAIYHWGRMVRVLEVCCGPGHVSLELARMGHNVTGIDVSQKCIEVAEQTAKDSIGEEDEIYLRYECADIHEYETDEKYDLIVFCNSLHHFGDLDKVLRKVDSLLDKDGVIFVSDPTKNDLTLSDAVIIHMIRTLLSLGGIYFESIDIPINRGRFLEEITKIKQEFSYKDSEHKNLQSPFDCSSNFVKMYESLKEFFTELEVSQDLAFFDKIIAGVRTDSIEKDKEVAKWLKEIDRILLDSETISSKQFTFIGKKI